MADVRHGEHGRSGAGRCRALRKLFLAQALEDGEAEALITLLFVVGVRRPQAGAMAPCTVLSGLACLSEVPTIEDAHTQAFLTIAQERRGSAAGSRAPQQRQESAPVRNNPRGDAATLARYRLGQPQLRCNCHNSSSVTCNHSMSCLVFNDFMPQHPRNSTVPVPVL